MSASMVTSADLRMETTESQRSLHADYNSPASSSGAEADCDLSPVLQLAIHQKSCCTLHSQALLVERTSVMRSEHHNCATLNVRHSKLLSHCCAHG